MKATVFLSAYSMVLALMVGAPTWAQEADEAWAQEAEEKMLLDQERALLEEKEAVNRAENRAKRAEALDTAAPPAILFIIQQIAVECDGECDDSTLGTICQSGWTPIAVDCQNVQEWKGARETVWCGDKGDNRCYRSRVLPTDRLSEFCDDGSGWDANVYCAR